MYPILFTMIMLAMPTISTTVLASNQVEVVQLQQPPATPEPTPQQEANSRCAVGETTRNDICAQWTAAEAGESAASAAWLFGSVGTLIGAGTLAAAALAARYAKLAAQHTEAAATIAKSIGEAQTKAYLVCSSAIYKIRKEHVSAELKIENIGNSPAVEVELFGNVTIYEILGTRSHFRVSRFVRSRDGKSGSQSITTKSTSTEEVTFFWQYDFEDETASKTDQEFRYDTFSTGNEISFAITIRYRDVFGNVENVPLHLDAIVDAHPLAVNKKRANQGKLTVRSNNDTVVDYPAT